MQQLIVNNTTTNADIEKPKTMYIYIICVVMSIMIIFIMIIIISVMHHCELVERERYNINFI